MLNFRVLLLACLLCAACSSDDPNANWRVSERWLDETSEVFAQSQIARWETVFDWTFDGPSASPWQAVDFDLADQATEGQWILSASRPGAFIERSVRLDGDTIDRLEVVMEGTGRRPLRLQWAGPDGDFSPRQSLEVRGEGQAGRYVFDLAAQRHWQDEIQRLRLTPTLPPKLRARLTSVRGLRSVPVPERRHRAAERTFKAELAQTSRTARLALPEAPWTHSVKVSGQPHLELAFGAERTLDRPLHFLVEARSDDGAGAGATLLEVTVVPQSGGPQSGGPQSGGPQSGGPQSGAPGSTQPDTLPAGRWYDRVIDLSPWEGQNLDLRFTVTAGNPDDDAAAYGFWGDVRLSHRHEDPPPPNVVLVVIDTLRADHLSLYGYPRPTSPNLERWAARRAVTFESVIAASPWTYPSHLSLFTGLDAVSHGQHHPRPLPRRFDLLAQQMQRAGYETRAITAGGYLNAHYGLARGFDRYFVVPGHLGPKGDLESGIERALQWNETSQRPFFLFFHTYEVHTPHRIRQPFYEQLSGRQGDAEHIARLTTRPLSEGTTAGAVRRKTYAWKDGQGGTQPLDDGELADVVDAYDSAIAYTDHHLARLLSALDSDHRSGAAPKPLVIITSDHGEALGEHQLADHSYLYDFNLRIPLLIALPDGRGAGQRVAPQVRQIDVLPTLLDSLGLPLPPMDGVSLLPLVDNPGAPRPPSDTLAWSATAYQGLSLRRNDRLKYVFNPTLWQREKAKEALFLLDRDPDEAHNLAAEHASSEELQRLAVERFMLSFEGLLLSFENPTAQTVTVSLDGPHWLGPQFYKSVDAPAGALGLDAAGRLEIRVPAQEPPFGVVLEQVSPRDRLELTLTSPAASCSLSLPGQTVQTDENLPVAYRFDAMCHPTSAGPSDGFVISLTYRHPGDDSPTVDADELPAELEQQLRALGYLD